MPTFLNLLVLFLKLSGRCGASSRRSCGNVTFGVDVGVYVSSEALSSMTKEHEDERKIQCNKPYWKNGSNLGDGSEFRKLAENRSRLLKIQTTLNHIGSSSSPLSLFIDAPHLPDSSRKSTSRFKKVGIFFFCCLLENGWGNPAETSCFAKLSAGVVRQIY